ncbi:hypothetical protein P280DRAFT_496511 [Massarina eburnea CBS 473.64]|uniref:Ams2/SPT21 N-terminal domain-containing protein n=1 Tax=Massarina eburnea CBS 473.64 TaxID=1395130 RepID=A0A6A6SB41_9PLEO|nr:hypothetical protein P280DRAFT_496511 [Massarina eburnea CBS 473.64]
MAMPSRSAEAAVQPASAADVDGEGMDHVPRRLMRVKVLYTFDDQNKSNCLARLPSPLSIPTVSLDETTQVGVIELKTCIQAVVTASPELVAKLGHDYTVYAYDYSEYETPLVGQGMLSWVLASASTTPNAPADQSQTMVTGRVCKNILGLFSNGIKETLEVKLKLVPVPTCMQSEYVENLERYHNLSKIVPEGLPSDYNAWAEFLEANPAIRQLAQPAAARQPQPGDGQPSAGVESFQEMLARQSQQAEDNRFDSFQDRRMSFDTRASSPALSSATFYQYQHQRPPRPASQASFYSESAAQSHYYARERDQEEQEEEPPKKRARITKAKRPKKAAVLGINHDSLRLSATSAASVRNHRPLTGNPGAAVSIEQVPRAPTPRPGMAGMPLGRGPLRPPAPSLLRHTSIDYGRQYASPYDMSDNGMESADEGKGRSPTDTPAHMPSSPPLMPRRTLSPARSSPELPSLPPNDSGFVSDLPTGRDEEETDARVKLWDGSDLPSVFQTMQRRRFDNTNLGTIEMEDVAPQEPETPSEADFMSTFQEQMSSAVATLPVPFNDAGYRRHASSLVPTETVPFSQPSQDQASGPLAMSQANACLPEANVPFSTTSGPMLVKYNNPGPPLDIPTNPTGQTRSKGLPRSHTWSAGEPMSDGAFTTVGGTTRQPRSGGKVKRQDCIRSKLQEALSQGKMPTYCNNCGQIDTPTWRKAYMRVEEGFPDNVECGSGETRIIAYEAIEPEQDDDVAPKYRIFKQSLTETELEDMRQAASNPHEENPRAFKMLTLCNPCGLWLNKKSEMRPHRVWAKSNNDRERIKRKRDEKRKNHSKKPRLEADTTMSDVVMPDSDANVPDGRDGSEAPPSVDGTFDEDIQPSLLNRTSHSQSGSNHPMHDNVAQAALIRAIQSSPVGMRRGTRELPVDLEADLTPKPTRRLLFPSPRKLGEQKSLSDNDASHSAATRTSAPHHIGSMARKFTAEDTDKENCPPATEDGDNEFAHLFDDKVSPKTTPSKGHSVEDLLKTPTPSARPNPLTPRRGTDDAEFITPSRMLRTPRVGGRAATAAPETPFTRQLNALLSDMPSSPSQAIDFSSFVNFNNTPGRNNTFLDFNGEFSSDFPMTSSPPQPLGFNVFEDPNTSTVGGIWSGASIFDGSDTMMSEAAASDNADMGQQTMPADLNMLKMHGISADFDVLIAQVTPSADSQAQTPDLTTPLPVTSATTPSTVSQVESSVGKHTPTPNPQATQVVEVANLNAPKSIPIIGSPAKNPEAHTGLSDAVAALGVDGAKPQPESTGGVVEISEQNSTVVVNTTEEKDGIKKEEDNATSRGETAQEPAHKAAAASTE